MIQAVIFDIDGTLVDSVDLHAQSWQEAFAHFGREIAFDAIRHQIGKGSDKLMPTLLSEEDLNRFGDELKDYRGELFKRTYLPRVRAFPRARALVERVRASGKRVALATSAEKDLLGRLKEIAGIADLVEQETSSGDAERSKPDPDIFAAALERLGLPGSEALAIGDTPYDAEAAGKLGMKTVGVLCGGFPADELTAAGCIALYQDPADLLARFDSSPLA